MANAVKGGWWSHGVAPPMWFTEVLTPPNWHSGESVQDELSEGEEYDTIPPIDPKHTARTLTEALNRMQAEVLARPGELHLRGTVRVSIPSEDDSPRPGAMMKAPDLDDDHALGSPSTGSPRT